MRIASKRFVFLSRFWYNADMKRSEIAFNLAAIPVDALMIFLAGFTAFYLRPLASDIVGPVRYLLSAQEFLLLCLVALPCLILLFTFFGLYNLTATKRLSYELPRIIGAVSIGLLVVFVGFFFNKSLFPSRFIVLVAWLLVIIFVSIGRYFLHEFKQIMFLRGKGLHRVVLINGGGHNARVLEQVFKNRRLGYEVVREIDYSPRALDELEKLYISVGYDEIIQANNEVSGVENAELVGFARNKGVEFSFVPNLFDAQRNRVETANYSGVPVISIKNSPLDGWGKVLKRVVDIIGSLSALIILSPVFLILYIAVKVDSKGPFIYSALRGGCGRDFRFYKIRSMYTHLSVGDEYGGQEAEKVRQDLWRKNDRGGKDSPFLKIKEDPRVTKVGRVIRRMKLDELPQFWNVLKGDMSLVGPRAHVLDEVARYRDRYRRMFSIKPGIFGVTQLEQISQPELPFEDEIRLNTSYIENWNMWMDIKLLVLTVYHLLLKPKSKLDY